MNSKVRFLKIYEPQTKTLVDPDLDEIDRKIIDIERRGGFYIYRILHKCIVRRFWKDRSGYPLKEKYYNNGYLVCSVSIRRLAEMTGFGDKKIQSILNDMEDVGWIVRDNQFTKKGQTVYILGKWGYDIYKVDGKTNKLYTEKLYFHDGHEEADKTSIFEASYTSKFNTP